MGGEHTFDDVGRCAGALEAMLSTLDVDTLTGEGATRLVRRLVRTERVVGAARAAAAKRAVDANQWRHAGERSAASWLAGLTGTSVGHAAAELATTERLGGLAATEAARRAGELSDLQTREVAAAATADPDAEAELLARAKVDDAKALAARCAEVKAAAERDEVAARRRIQRARRFRSWRDGEGAFCYAGRCLAEDGAALLAAMRPHQDRLFHAARRRGEREPTEAYAHDALMALAHHECRQGTTTESDQPLVTDDTAPPTGDERSGDERAVDQRRDDQHTGGERTGDERPPNGASGMANGTGPVPGAPGGDTDLDRARAGNVVPDRAGNHDPHTQASPEGTPTTRLVGTLFTGQGDVDHTSSRRTTAPGEHGQPTATPAHAGGRPARDRAGPPAKIIVRIDHTALVRGHTVPGEVCDIAGVGPIPVAAARELARNAFLTAVVTHGIDVTHVVHLGRAATAHQRTALQARGMVCAVSGCGTTAGLEIDHVDGWAITRRTRLDQLDWLCHHHHGQKTHHSYRLAGSPGQRTWHPPDAPSAHDTS